MFKKPEIFYYHSCELSVFPDDDAENMRLLLLQLEMLDGEMEITNPSRIDKLVPKKASVQCRNEEEAGRVEAALNRITTDAVTVMEHIAVSPQVARLMKENFSNEYEAMRICTFRAGILNRPY